MKPVEELLSVIKILKQTDRINKELIKDLSKEINTLEKTIEESSKASKEKDQLIKDLYNENSILQKLSIFIPDKDYKYAILAVCNYYGFSKEQILRRNNKLKICSTRHMICYILHEYYKLGTTDIGRLLRRDHSSADHSVNTIKNMIEQKNRSILYDIIQIKKQIK